MGRAQSAATRAKIAAEMRGNKNALKGKKSKRRQPTMEEYRAKLAELQKTGHPAFETSVKKKA